MNYEIITLEEKTIVGILTSTSNADPQMQAIIGNIWDSFYQDGIYQSIKNKLNPYAIGLYSDYTTTGYSLTVGSEVSKCENAELITKVIPSGTYAKFSVQGSPIQEVVSKAWAHIWQLDLDRSFTGDFEEYLCSDGTNGHIDIYIALK